MTCSIDDVIAFARGRHEGQKDKAGAPYIEHPLRVMGRLPPGDVTGRMAAVLHDVVEDQGVTSEELRALGVPAEVIEAVVILSHPKGEDDDVYWARIAGHALAKRVKLADIADNSDESRLALLPAEVASKLRAKYAKARTAIGS